MKVLVLSDSHGNTRIVQKIKNKERADLNIHLGDYGRDLNKGIAVRGNCDGFSSLPALRLVELEGYKLLITHGHKEGVKKGLHNLFYLAKEKQADIVLYGHTHMKLEKEIDGILFLNPGSIAQPHLGDKPSYLIINFENSGYKVEFVEL